MWALWISESFDLIGASAQLSLMNIYVGKNVKAFLYLVA